MNSTFFKQLLALALLLSLLACGSHVKPTGKLSEMSRDEFMSALRWKRFPVASSLIVEEHRQAFMNTFLPLKDIHITDVRLVNLQIAEENRRFETIIEMEYYLPPSATVKTFRFDQTWKFFDGDDPLEQGYMIVTPFPEFP